MGVTYPKECKHRHIGSQRHSRPLTRALAFAKCTLFCCHYQCIAAKWVRMRRKYNVIHENMTQIDYCHWLNFWTRFYNDVVYLSLFTNYWKCCTTKRCKLLSRFIIMLYPNRSVGIGVCSMCSRIAGILSPVILLLSDYWQPLPVLIFGITSIVAGLLILLLPETRGAQLPETLEEGETFGTQETIIIWL